MSPTSTTPPAVQAAGPLSDQRLAEIAARAAAATKGPWMSDGAEIYRAPWGYVVIDMWVGETLRIEDQGASNADAEFVAAAREDVPALLAEVDRLLAVESGARKLINGWKQSSAEHAQLAKSKVMGEMPGMADKQEGRSLQLVDCADELADVLKGEDPDEWQYGVGMDVLDRDERDADGGAA